jgi:hypothetical protein
MGLSPFMLIVALIVFYLILGCFLDGFSMIVLTLPIVLPIVKQAGFDRLVRHLPGAGGRDGADHPAGRVQPVRDPGLTGDGLGYIAKVTLPYLVIMVLFTLVITVFPQIALFLPNPADGTLSHALLPARCRNIVRPRIIRDQKMAKFGSGRRCGASRTRGSSPGQGRYVDDITLPGMVHGVVLLSPHAHARIKTIDTAKAKAAPGVLLVLTGADAGGRQTRRRSPSRMMPEDLGAPEGAPHFPAGAAGREGALRRRPRCIRRSPRRPRKRAMPPR